MFLIFGLYLILGIAAGFVAGLFGIGGGILIVPVLAFCFSVQGVSTEVLMHSAVATSLATIVFTSISSVIAHQRKKAVHWEIVARVVVGIVLGAVLGALIADSLSGIEMQVAFAIFALLMAVKMGFSLQPAVANPKHTSTAQFSIAGLLIGGASTVFGIGGGSLSVPYLSWRGVRMQEAVATSSAIGLPLALMGAVSNIWTGWDSTEMGDYSLGYIYLPAFVGIILTSTLSARFGARLAHHLEQKKLKRCFAIFLLIVGVNMLYKSLV